MGLETLSSKKKNLTAEFISHTFGETRFFAKNRVGSEGVTGLKPRGRPPRLDDKTFSHTHNKVLLRSLDEFSPFIRNHVANTICTIGQVDFIL